MIYEIRSGGTRGGNGFPDGIRRIISARRSPKSVAENETTDEEKNSGSIYVRNVHGPGRGDFWIGDVKPRKHQQTGGVL